MKKIFVCTILFLVSARTFCQHIDTVTISRKAALYIKSQNQRSTGWVMLVGGSGLVLGGMLIGNRKNSSFAEAGAGVIMGGLGVVSAIGSIPVFLGSARNKRRSEQMTYLELLSINNQWLCAPGQVVPSSTCHLKLRVMF